MHTHGAEEMTPSVKYLPCNHEDLTSHLQPGTVLLTGKASSREGEILGTYWSSQSNLNQ